MGSIEHLEAVYKVDTLKTFLKTQDLAQKSANGLRKYVPCA